MGKIALIDTYADEAVLKNCSVEHINLTDEKWRPGPEIGHGTMCAAILDRCTSNFELINFQILQDTGRNKSFAGVDVLAKALKMCIEMGVDIVSLSSVSSYLNDSKYLYDIVRELTNTASVVSALDNARYVTVPTSYSFVAGVQNDTGNVLLPGEIAYSKDDPFNAGIYANCNFEFLKEYGYSPSNSFAVPVVAAHLHNQMLNGKTAKDAENAIVFLTEYSYKRPLRTDVDSRPIILIAGRSEYAHSLCVGIMDELYNKHDVFTAALSVVDDERDARVRKLTCISKTAQEVLFIENHYKADIVFVVCDEDEVLHIQSEIQVDITVFTGKINIKVVSELGETTAHRNEISDMLYNMLTD